MNKVLNIYKPVGLTPYDIIKKIKKNAKYKNVVIGYAGRLDPMAEGVLLLLLDEENKKRKEYERLNKKYECKFLFGIETDSYDVLGLIKEYTLNYKIKNNLQKELDAFTGKQKQYYPPFSSARVNGKPLFYWARENKLDQISIPSKEITIHDIFLLHTKCIDQSFLKQYVVNKLYKIEGDFRQEIIKDRWENFFNNNPYFSLLTISCLVECSSGTYIRSLAHSIGRNLGTGGIALSIKRTAVGEYTLEKSLKL